MTFKLPKILLIISADNRTKATLPQNGVNNDCAAPNCNIEAAGLLKESVNNFRIATRINVYRRLGIVLLAI